jgi:hypothetical protein
MVPDAVPSLRVSWTAFGIQPAEEEMGIISEKARAKVVKDIAESFAGYFGIQQDYKGNTGADIVVKAIVNEMVEELKSAAWNLLGAEVKWGEAKFTYNSPLKDAIVSAIRARAEQEAKDLLKNHDYKLTAKEAKDIGKDIREKYLESVHEAAMKMVIEYGEKAGEEQVKAILGELFPESDGPE